MASLHIITVIEKCIILIFYRLMNLATERLKTIFSHSAYYFENQANTKEDLLSEILIVCTYTYTYMHTYILHTLKFNYVYMHIYIHTYIHIAPIP